MVHGFAVLSHYTSNAKSTGGRTITT